MGFTRVTSRLCVAWVLLLAAAACTEPVARRPSVIEVRVDADSIVRDETVRVEIDVDSKAEAGSGWRDVERVIYRMEPQPFEWPIEFKLKPERTLGESYGLVAIAFDKRDAIVARAQAIRDGEAAVDGALRVHFETSCFRQAPLCTEGLTCHRGECLDANDATPLPAADAGLPDSGPPEPPVDPLEGVGKEGETCGVQGEGACTGQDSRYPLRCEEGSWRAQLPCADTERCDTKSGDGRGACKPVATECLNHKVSEPFCADGTMLVCNDPFSSMIRPCGEFARCAPGPIGAECKCEPGYAKDVNDRCLPATECGSNNGACDPLTDCSTSSGVKTCSACPSEYTGTGEDGCAPILQGLSIAGGVLIPEYDPTVREYRVQVPIVSPQIQLTATAPGTTRVTFDSVAMPSGEPWTSPVLAVGPRRVALVLTTEFGISTDYTLAIERSGEQTSYIKPSNSDPGDWFGLSISSSGDTLVAGSFFDDSAATTIDGDQGNGSNDTGAAFVFQRSGRKWSQTAYIKANDAQSNDFFGTSVSIEGDVLAVGAVHSSLFAEPTSPTASDRSGAAYVFTRQGGKWSQQQRMTASNAQNGDLFGVALDISGDTLAIGASWGSKPGGPRGGAVYMFEREGAGWKERQILTPSVASRHFGASLTLIGDQLIVGAPGEADDTGAAYVFVRSGGMWMEQERLRPDTLEAGSKFGYSAAILGDRAAVGAPHPPAPGSTARVPPGEVYVFERASGRWEETALVRAPIPGISDFFGASVVLTERALAIGSNGEDSRLRGVNPTPPDDSAEFSGAAYLFANTGGSKWESSVFLKAGNAEPNAGFGFSIALEDDYIAVAAPLERAVARGIDSTPSSNTGSYDSGSLYVFE